MENPLFKKVGSLTPHAGHTLFEINHNTQQVVVAEFIPSESGKKKVLVKEGCEYVSALNMKNAIKKYLKKTKNHGKTSII